MEEEKHKIELSKITDEDLEFGIHFFDKSAELFREAEKRFGTSDINKIQEIVCGKIAERDKEIFPFFQGKEVNVRQNAKFDYNDGGDCKVSKSTSTLLFDKVYEEGIEEKIEQAKYFVIGIKNKFDQLRFMAYINELNEDFKKDVKEKIRTKQTKDINKKSRFHAVSFPISTVLKENKVQMVRINKKGKVIQVYDKPNEFMKDVRKWRKETK